MWSILHFVFIYFCKPSAWMHVIASFLFGLLTQINTKTLSLKDFFPSLAVLGLYIGFYLTGELWHFCYLPWWVVTICGFRNQRPFISFGGVLLGFILSFYNWRVKVGHCIMNISRMIKLEAQSMASLCIVHIVLSVMFYFLEEYSTETPYVDVLSGVSIVMASCFPENISWFSIVMLFTNHYGMGLAFLHLMSHCWWDYYKNNHFRKVKYSFFFVYPVLILLALWFREELEYIRSYKP